MSSQKFKYESCSCQIKLPDEYIERIQKWSQRFIPDDFLYDDGSGTYLRDPRSHVTISLGLQESQQEALKGLVKLSIGADLVANKVEIWEMEKFDVVFVSVLQDDALTQLYEKVSALAMKKYLRHKFSPHISIAFVKPGLGKKILRKLQWEDVQELEKYDWKLQEVELVTREGKFESLTQ